MTPDKLKDTVATCLEIAKANLSRDDYLAPAGIIIYGDNQYDMVSLAYDDTEQSKQSVADQFIALARRLKATAVITIFDAWAATVQVIPTGKRVRDLPEAKDVIIVSGHMPDFQTMVAAYYVKTDQGFVFVDDDELNKSTPGQSRFTDGIWETHSITDAPQ